MRDALGAAMIRAHLRNQSCADRGGRCECDLTCRVDMDDIVAAASVALRAEVRAIMQPTRSASAPADVVSGQGDKQP